MRRDDSPVVILRW